MKSVKEKISKLYIEKGYQAAIVILKNLGITAALFLGIFIISGSFSLSGILEMLMALPLFSIVIGLFRIIIRIINKPLKNSFIIKVVLDFVVFGIVTMAFGYYLGKIPFPESAIVQALIVILFDGIYVALIVFLLMSKRKQKKDIEDEKEETERA